MTKLININELAELAVEKGFRVRYNSKQVELWYPDNNISQAHWYDGCFYSTADIVIDSTPGIGYGYNESYNGPYHYGYAHADSYGVKKFREYLK